MTALVAPAERVPGYVPPLAMFLARRVAGQAGARLDWQDIYRAFVADGWRSVPPPQQFGQGMAWLCRAKGVRVEVDGGCIYCLDCRLVG